jgi:hypothetical protein
MGFSATDSERALNICAMVCVCVRVCVHQGGQAGRQPQCSAEFM